MASDLQRPETLLCVTNTQPCTQRYFMYPEFTPCVLTDQYTAHPTEGGRRCPVVLIRSGDLSGVSSWSWAFFTAGILKHQGRKSTATTLTIMFFTYLCHAASMYNIWTLEMADGYGMQPSFTLSVIVASKNVC